MAKQKSVEELRRELMVAEAELEKAKQKLEQERHKMIRMDNRVKSESKKMRDARTHALCFKAGHLEHVFPVIKDYEKTKFVQFVDGLSKIPEVKEYVAGFVFQQVEEVSD